MPSVLYGAYFKTRTLLILFPGIDLVDYDVADYGYRQASYNVYEVMLLCKDCGHADKHRHYQRIYAEAL